MAELHQTYAQDEDFWNKYFKGRPQVPDALFERVCSYHASHGGSFGVVHDVGAGAAVHSPRLAKYFERVIVSDVAQSNVDLAKQRLGTEKYSYKATGIEDDAVAEEGSVDMVFAATMMHYADYDKALPAVAKQLKPGGTFVVLGTGPVVLPNKQLGEVWDEMWFEGIRMLLRQSSNRKERLGVLAKSACGYDTMPLDEKYFLPGALRVTLNTEDGTWTSMMPDDVESEMESEFGPLQSAIGTTEKVSAEHELGWSFKADINRLREIWATFPFATREPETFRSMWTKVERLLPAGTEVDGVWPAKLIMATRR